MTRSRHFNMKNVLLLIFLGILYLWFSNNNKIYSPTVSKILSPAIPKRDVYKRTTLGPEILVTSKNTTISWSNQKKQEELMRSIGGVLAKKVKVNNNMDKTTLSARYRELVRKIKAQRASPRMRTASNGAWVRFKDSVDFFGYSAFRDTRPSIGEHKTIIRIIAIVVVIATVQNNEPTLPHCLFDDTTSVQATEQQIGMGVDLFDKHYKEFIFSCKLKPEMKSVQYVSLVYPSEGKINNTSVDRFLPIETPVVTEEKKDVAICVSVTYWKQDFRRVVEWIELNRMMGVSHITIYNNSMDDASSRIFSAYMNSKNGLDEDFLELRQSHRFLDSDLEVNFHLHMSPVINDCMYRNMNLYRKIEVVDLDELIVPVKNQSIYEMLLDIDRNIQNTHPARSFTFRNSYHFLNFPKTNNSPLTIISHAMAAPVTIPGDSVKSIIDPQACAAMHNHYCWQFTTLFNDENANIEVPTNYGLNQHYKNCHIDEYLNTNGECDKIMKKGVKDPSTDRYKIALETIVNNKIKELNLH